MTNSIEGDIMTSKTNLCYDTSMTDQSGVGLDSPQQGFPQTAAKTANTLQVGQAIH